MAEKTRTLGPDGREFPVTDELCPLCKKLHLFKDAALNAHSQKTGAPICQECATAEALYNHFAK